LIAAAQRVHQPDYDVIYKDPDGREPIVGRIFRNHGFAGGERRWFWGKADFDAARQWQRDPLSARLNSLIAPVYPAFGLCRHKIWPTL
jgi:hypothetical protein